jgi:dipeptidyl aminopeptidase/acylaminoacyl peptidase
MVYVSDVDPDARPRNEDEQTRKRHPRVRVVNRIYYRGDTLGWRGDAHRQLFRVDVATGKTARLTRGDYDHATPVFSPDGSMLAFQSGRSRSRHLRAPFGGELCVMPVEGGRVRRLTPNTWNVSGIAWSPDGKEIACVASDLQEREQPYVHVVDVENKRCTRLTDDALHPQTGMFPIQPPPQVVWKDNEILFVADSRASSGLYGVDMQGEVRGLRLAQELVTGVSTASDGFRIAFVSSSPGQPPELAAMDVAGGPAARLTHISDDYIQDHPAGAVERFILQRSGYDIDCWLMFPPDFDPNKRYPLVLEVHGGPNGFFGTGFNVLHQIIAGAGNVVLFVNPRGSTTYGTEFTAQVWRNWGGEDYLDLITALDEACRRPYINGARMGIHGYSYGGFMTSWAVGHTDRFSAAVVGAPVTNLVSMYGQTDIGVNFGEHQWGGRPHERLDWYIEHSPITYAEKVTTPVLLLHGEEDIRCPISQSEEYYVALKRSGKRVEFVRFPGCSHLFLRVGHPEMRQQYYDRVTAWFSQWLA